MKFGRQYQESLLEEGFPAGWVNSAISYRRLKKCIKGLRRELDALGLDGLTLRKLLESHEENDTEPDPARPTGQGRRGSKPFVYTFDDENGSPIENNGTVEKKRPILPKLLFVVDEETGEPLGATFSRETKNFLHQLAVSEKVTKLRITDDDTNGLELVKTQSEDSTEGLDDADPENPTVIIGKETPRPTKLVQVPLVSDSLFFEMLEKELHGLVELQEKEQDRLTKEIKDVGHVLGKVTKPDSKSAKADLDKWRKLFELYLDSRVFFVATEREHSTYTSVKATKQWTEFLGKADDAKLLNKFKIPESKLTLKRFLAINSELIKTLRFQEMNQTAMTKILKKFDKRTALGASNSFVNRFQPSSMPTDFSKALCAEVSSSILAVVPQLDDYMCPICMSIAYRPIRLRCGHLFCIRCLIVLQRQQRDQCALCREKVVMEANSGNLDPVMSAFLEKYFSFEVKEKQKSNERALAVDQFGESAADDRCVLM